MSRCVSRLQSPTPQSVGKGKSGELMGIADDGRQWSVETRRSNTQVALRARREISQQIACSLQTDFLL